MNISIDVSEELGQELAQMAAADLVNRNEDPQGLSPSELVKTLILSVFRPRLIQYRQSIVEQEHEAAIQKVITAKTDAITDAIQSVSSDLSAVTVTVE